MASKRIILVPTECSRICCSFIFWSSSPIQRLMVGSCCVEVAGRLSGGVGRGVGSAVGIRSARVETESCCRSWRIVGRETRWRPTMRWKRVRLAVTRVWKASSHGRTPTVHLRRLKRHRIRHCPRPIENWFLGTWHHFGERKNEFGKTENKITSHRGLISNEMQFETTWYAYYIYLVPGL